MNVPMVVGAALLVAPFIALTVCVARDLGWKATAQGVAMIAALFTVIGVGAFLLDRGVNS